MFKNLSLNRVSWIVFILIGIVAISAFHTYSLWLPVDEFVDESELAYYAVGFFGLDFDPHWYGYGNLGMYLLYCWYMLLFVFEWLAGNVTNIDEFAQRLFDSTYFIEWGRFLFAIIGVGTIAIYGYVLKKYTQSIFIALIFFLVSVVALETIHFANYLRPDQLVSFFVSILVLLLIDMKQQKLYYLAIITAALISSKISTLFLGIFLAFYVVYYYLKKEITIKKVFLICLVFFIAMIVFQPYNNPVSLIKSLLSMQSDPDVLLGNKPYMEKAISVINYSYSHITQYVNKYLLYALFLLPFLQKKYYRFAFIILIAIFLLVSPYIFDNGVVRYYWLNPVYDLIRLLGILALYNFFVVLVQKFSHKKNIKIITNVLLFLFLIPTIYMGVISYKSVLDKYKTPSNKSMAKSWIEENLIGKHNIYVDGHRNHMMPKVYDIHNIHESENLSRVFIFNKHKNEYLHKQFQRYLQNGYLENIDHKLLENNVIVKKLYAFDINDTVMMNKIKDSYFITSPAIYNGFIKQKFVRIGHKHKEVNSVFRNHYMHITSNKLIKRIKEGTGATIEIYYIK